MIRRHQTITYAAADRRAVVASHLVRLGWVLGLALVTALAAKIQVPMIPVPLTLQTAVVLLAGLLLGPIAGAASQVLYLGMGLAGLPVFAGPIAGPGYLFGPTAGYLIAFIPAAVVAGWIAGPGRHALGRLVLGAAAATAVIFVLGVAWLAAVQPLGLPAALAVGLIPFLPGAVLKMAIVISATRLLDAGGLARRRPQDRPR